MVSFNGEGTGSEHATYHLKFEEYVPLQSESVMRSYSTAMTGSKPTTSSAAAVKETQQSVSSEQLPSTAIRPRADSSNRKHAPPTPANPTRGRFINLNSDTDSAVSADFAYGIIHLYRDITSTLDAEITSVGRRKGSPEEENVLAILAVPSYMTANDFMGFVGEREQHQVSHFRLIRTEAANRYMVLLNFRTSESAKAFHKEFDGKAFNSMEVFRSSAWVICSRRPAMSYTLRASLFKHLPPLNSTPFSHSSMIPF
jgi:BRCA1-associated protein 2